MKYAYHHLYSLCLRAESTATFLVIALLLPCALALPSLALAVSIGEIVSQSKLGEPLSIRVELLGGVGENIDSSCLSLQTPDPNEENIQDYLVTAQLAVKTEMGRQFGIITSHKPFNEAFGKIKLRINCRGQGSVTKTLTFLPDLDAAQPAPIAMPTVSSTDQAPPAIALALNPATTLNTQAVTQRGLKSASAAPRISSPLATTGKNIDRQSSKKRSAIFERTARKKHRSEVFMFKLSSEPLDESRIGKISAEEREILLARQKLLDADDQMASYLAMQHQIKQLQDELGDIKLKLSQLNPSPAPLPAANTAFSSHFLPDTKEQKIGFFVGGLVLAILALLFGLRYYNRMHTQILGQEIWDSGTTEPPQKIASPVSRSPSVDAGSDSGKYPTAVSSPAVKPSIGGASPLTTTKSQEELSEADSIIEEAELYSTYGHPERAILMLQELIEQFPTKTEAWELLLFILSSQKKVAEFEQATRDFMNLNKNSASWIKIKEMRRSLERDNASPIHNPDEVEAIPLQTASGKRLLIGKILVDTGMLSALDMKNYLDDFDPKLDGRIGEYLVSRQAITNEQLNEALRLQQGGEAAVNQKPITLDMESLLPDSSSMQDKRLDEYLKMDMSRNNKPKKT